jgi:hypothetical protein
MKLQFVNKILRAPVPSCFVFKQVNVLAYENNLLGLELSLSMSMINDPLVCVR